MKKKVKFAASFNANSPAMRKFRQKKSLDPGKKFSITFLFSSPLFAGKEKKNHRQKQRDYSDEPACITRAEEKPVFQDFSGFFKLVREFFKF